HRGQVRAPRPGGGRLRGRRRDADERDQRADHHREVLDALVGPATRRPGAQQPRSQSGDLGAAGVRGGPEVRGLAGRPRFPLRRVCPVPRPRRAAGGPARAGGRSMGPGLRGRPAVRAGGVYRSRRAAAAAAHHGQAGPRVRVLHGEGRPGCGRRHPAVVPRPGRELPAAQGVRVAVRIEFPYPGYEHIAPVEVPDTNLAGVFSPRALREVDEGAVLREGFAHPVGAPALRDVARAGDRVLILVDDATRLTPAARVLPLVLDQLHAAGVPDARIEFLQAPGTHRPMTEAELRDKLGGCFGRYAVHEHHYLDESSLHDFGRTRDGTRVTANRLLAERDLVLGVGSIVPHRIKGFSGGAKIAFPGVSGREMMERNQWEASMHMAVTVMGVAENPMRLRME